MSREIKFRIMYKKYPNIWLKDEYTLRDLIEMDGAGFLGDDDIIEQYTGLKDKNGKEIYEGDIVRIMGFGIYKVFWRTMDSSFSLKAIDTNIEEHKVLMLCGDWESDYEVIGNIHENQELLKRRKK